VPPETQYAKRPDGVSIAYHIASEGDHDILIAWGFMSHLEINWEFPPMLRLYERLGSLGRLIEFDRAGVGLSDPWEGPHDLDSRTDDITAVLDAVESESATLIGFSEGGPMSLLYAAAHPDRVERLILYGAMARSTEAPDYPFASSAEAFMEAAQEWLLPDPGGEAFLEVFAPSSLRDKAARAWYSKRHRYAATPATQIAMGLAFLSVDVRSILPQVNVPTLILHRRGDRVVSVHGARWLADQLPQAELREFPGQDHSIWSGDAEPILDAMEEIITGRRATARPDRVLATVLFTDIVASAEHTAAAGDARWRETMEAHNAVVAEEVVTARGRLVKRLGDGVLATFDAPGRALAAALAIVERVATLGVDVRAGLHTGECEFLLDDVGGIAVTIASRVADLAGPSEVLVSRTVKELVVGSAWAFDDRGQHGLKGIPEPWQLYAVHS
jgi:class 3 adenylate cyclase